MILALERHVDDITDMRRSCRLRENITGRRPLGSSSRLLKVPIDDDDEFRIFLEAMEEGIYNFNQRESNWRLQRVDNLVINLADYEPTGGSSYIPLPEELSSKYSYRRMPSGSTLTYFFRIIPVISPSSVMKNFPD